MQKKVSLKDIAERAQVSVATVSYALSNKRKEVSEELMLKVKKIAEEMNYHPNTLARSLKQGKSNTIGLIIADISNPFFAQIARIAEDEARKFGYDVLFASSDENFQKSKDLIEKLIHRQIDGIMLTPVENTEDQISQLVDIEVPLVLFDRHFPNIKTNYVIIDNRWATYQATKLLIDNNKKRIAIVAYKTSLTHITNRIKGYKDALRELSTQKDDFTYIISHKTISEDIAKVIEDISLNKIDAVVTTTNTISLELLTQINQAKLHVPSDISLVSFDESESFNFFYCPLSYIKQPIVDITRRAINILINNIENTNVPIREVVIKPSLVVRKSSN